ncbi:MAG: N-acetylmuramoyl-L-alanine amidase [Candidatus Aminicenantes bacterium]|nr:MAG: N-acetylmuramoyl-L-alanine amidase [Candidatus Aminicenantes bacterium]
MKSAPKSFAFLLLTAVVLSLAAAPQDDPRVEIVNLRRFTHPNFTRVVIDIGKFREYTFGELRDPGRIYIDVLQAKLNPILQGQSYPVKADYVSQIRVSQKTTSTVRLVVDVDFSRIQSYRVYHLFDPYRLVVDIYPHGAGQAPAQAQLPAEKPPRPGDKVQRAVKRQVDPNDPNLNGTSLARQLGLGVRTVVIDPGHGGPRPGSIGKNGLQEKEVNLAIALALRKLLKEKAGIDAILTRESDVDVGLDDRTVIANQKRADLFVSIHANAHRDRKRGGVETFFLNVSPDPSVIELAAAENATSTKNIGEMKSILDKIVQNSKIQESHDLAQAIQRNLVRVLARDLPAVQNLGVKGGPFWVLIGGEMPSVLVEVSHLSNAKEEAKLKTSKYRDLAAQGIYDGIMEYIHSLGKG